VRCIVGLLKATSGSIRLEGRRIDGWTADRIGRAGVALVPEGRRIFANLSVRENLLPSPPTEARRESVDGPARLRVVPRLAERAGNMGSELSGGEQQMLAIGRALMTNPSSSSSTRRRKAWRRCCAKRSGACWPRSAAAVSPSWRSTSMSTGCEALRAPHHPGARAGCVGRQLDRARRRPRLWQRYLGV